MSVLLRPRVLTATIASLAFAAVALPSHAMQDEGKAGAAAAATVPASLLVFDQKLDAKSVKLSYVYVPEKSVAVVYADGAESKKPLGTLEVAPGDHRDLKIALADEPAKGSKLWVSLYRDKDGKAERAADHAYWADAKLPSTNGFTVQ
ncbi:MAG: hypothetical protein IKE66_15425 [Hyphomicrobium sp.]|nr:hypothetical protein [Hyphomicrobium sp.]